MSTQSPPVPSSLNEFAPDIAPALFAQRQAEQILRANENFVAGQRDAFELAMNGAPIDIVMGRIVRMAWEIFESDGGVRAAIFTVDEDGKHLRFGVAAELAESYTCAVNGLEIGPNSPSCGRAAYTGQSVIVGDVATDPLWAPYLELARAHDIAACWSFPIRAVGGRVLGTLAIYHRTRREPEARHLASIGLLAETAAMVLERHRMSEERRTADEKLRLSEARYRTVFDMTPVAIYSIDTMGMIKEFNLRAAELWGRTPAVGDSDERFCGAFKLFRPDGSFMPHASTPMEEVVSGKIAEARDVEVIIERPDGSRVTVVVNIRPLRNDRGEITGAVNCFYDITDRKLAEALLQESERFLASSLDAMTSNITVLDKMGVILAVNESWRKFADQNRVVGDTHGVGTNYLDACGEARAGDLEGAGGLTFATAIRDVIAGHREMYEAEYPCHSPTERRWFLMQVTRFQGPGPVRVVIVHENITARKRAEEALKEARHAAESANEAKDKFLAVLSHELRTPLTPVVMTLAELEMNEVLPTAVRADLKMIRRNVELEVKLIDDLLDISRITSGKLHLKLSRVDLNELLRHACDMCRSKVQEKGIRLHRDLDEQAGDIIGDPSRLHQVFWNLLNNAVKFTPEGGDIYVTTGSVSSDGHDRSGHPAMVRATVRDTGRGIARDVLPRIFDAFEQGDVQVTRNFGGLGLGLAISKKLVEQHHGSIRAQTDGPDKGSTFIVELPAAPSEEAAQVPEKLLPGPGGSIIPLRVLVVEDHADTARILARLMKGSGHVVKTATTGAAALALAGAHVFDLIVSDLGLPDVTGYDLMREIKGKYGTPGIAMSGNGQDEDIKKSGLAGFSEHLVKPVDFSRLEQAMRRVAAERPSTPVAPLSEP